MNMPQWLVIGVSGVTCGGKTTLSQNLRDYFQSKQNTRIWQAPYTIGDVQLISQDDYFLPVDDRRHKWVEKLNAINFELLTSLDMKQMLSDITWTMKGRYLVGDPMENVDFINEISMSSPNYEQYNGVPVSLSVMPPPTQMLHYHNNKMQQQSHQQQQQQHYQTTNLYYQNNHSHQQHHHRPHQQQQSRQHHQQQQQQHQQPQQQRHSMRIAANAVTANNSNNVASLKQRDCKVNILIIDGFMIFNQPELLTLCNIKFHFHLPYEKCFERRRQRVYDPPDVTGYFEICVWPYYEKNFAEFRDRKDITFLNGEIGKERIRDFVLQKIAKYVEERCDALMMPTTTTATFTAPPPAMPTHHKVIGMHNGNNGCVIKPCPMEQQ